MTSTTVGVIGLAYPPLMPRTGSGASSKTEEFYALVESLRGSTVVDSVFWADSRSDIDEIASSEIGRELDIVLVVPMTAAPPDWGVSACPNNAIVVVWDCSPGARVPTEADQATAHADTSSIGALLQGGGLLVQERSFTTISGSGENGVGKVVSTLRIATAAAQMRASKILQIEQPVAGYSTLNLAGVDTSKIGLEIDFVEVDSLVPASERQPTDSHEISQTLARLITDAVRSRRCDAVAMNCHSTNFKGSPDIGVVGCMAASGQTPTACTGDVPTAWLLLMLRRLTGSGIYCEPYTIDDSRKAVLLANCGIGMESMAVPGTWRVAPTQYYPGVNGLGDSTAMAVMPGKATFVTSRGWQAGSIELVVCEGEISADRLPDYRASLLGLILRA